MATRALIPVEVDLTSVYRPDCDYVDGELIERNLGTKDHGILQGEVFAWFRDRRRELRLRAIPEMRVRVSARRFGIPDMCVVLLPEPESRFSRSRRIFA